MVLVLIKTYENWKIYYSASFNISAHFTNTLYPVAVFFLFLYHFTAQESFRSTYFYLMVLATITSQYLGYLGGKLAYGVTH
jgi:hypothetical protein